MLQSYLQMVHLCSNRWCNPSRWCHIQRTPRCKCPRQHRCKCPWWHPCKCPRLHPCKCPRLHPCKCPRFHPCKRHKLHLCLCRRRWAWCQMAWTPPLNSNKWWLSSKCCCSSRCKCLFNNQWFVICLFRCISQLEILCSLKQTTCFHHLEKLRSNRFCVFVFQYKIVFGELKII